VVLVPFFLSKTISMHRSLMLQYNTISPQVRSLRCHSSSFVRSCRKQQLLSSLIHDLLSFSPFVRFCMPPMIMPLPFASCMSIRHLSFLVFYYNEGFVGLYDRRSPRYRASRVCSPIHPSQLDHNISCISSPSSSSPSYKSC